MTSPADAIGGAVAVTKDWAKQRKAEERNRNAVFNRRTRLVRSARVTIKDAAFEVMAEAYEEAAGPQRLPVKPRQIMYRARPYILRATGENHLTDSYFTQDLLIEYMEQQDCFDWDIIWDARGHFTEPHTRHRVEMPAIFKNKTIGELDWDGNIVWQWGETAPGGAAQQHHDWARLPNGDTLVLSVLSYQIPGFTLPKQLDDVIYEVTPKGDIVWKWIGGDHLNEFGFTPEALMLVKKSELPD